MVSDVLVRLPQREDVTELAPKPVAIVQQLNCIYDDCSRFCVPDKPTMQKMPNSVTIHKSRIIRLLKQHPTRINEIFPPGSFANATKAITALQLSPHNWFIDGTLAENERITAKVTNVQIGNSLVNFSRNPVGDSGTGVNRR